MRHPPAHLPCPLPGNLVPYLPRDSGHLLTAVELGVESQVPVYSDDQRRELPIAGQQLAAHVVGQIELEHGCHERAAAFCVF